MRHVQAIGIWALCLLIATPVWAAEKFSFNFDTGKLDKTLDASNLGEVTASLVTITGLDCTGFGSGGAVTTDVTGNLVCSADDTAAAGTTTWDAIIDPVGNQDLDHTTFTTNWDNADAFTWNTYDNVTFSGYDHLISEIPVEVTGSLTVFNQSPVRFGEATGNGGQFVSLKAPATLASDTTQTLQDVTGRLTVQDGLFTTGAIPFGEATGPLVANKAKFSFDEPNTRLGVGTSSPRDWIHVRNDRGGSVAGPYASNAEILIEDHGASNNGIASLTLVGGFSSGFSFVNFGDLGNNIQASMEYRHATDTMTFNGGNPTRDMILYTQNGVSLGVGSPDTSPDAALDVSPFSAATVIQELTMAANQTADAFHINTTGDASTLFRLTPRSSASSIQQEITGQLTVFNDNSIGWSVVVAANQACNVSCDKACVFGQDTDTANGPIVGCSDASADRCTCAGDS